MVNKEPTVIRSLLFPHSDICEIKELYYRTDDPSVRYCEEEEHLKINGTAGFDTYFNSFSVVKYKEYCTLSDLHLRLRVCGSFVLRVFGVNKTSDGYREKQLTEVEFSLDKSGEFIADLSSTLDLSADTVYFTLTSDGGRLFGGEFFTLSDMVNDVDIAVVICTFKREKYLLHNHAAICRYLEKNKLLNNKNIHFYIVDNGRTLDPSVIENENVTLVPNDNTGGSGGFTRGYYEAVSSGRKFSHILFMDDDIVLDCEMLLRVYAILRLRSSKMQGLSVGGTMIRLSNMAMQHEAGSFWDGKRLHSIGTEKNITKRENVFDISYYRQGNYNAWWFFCFPADWHEKHGYPLQLFVKLDDIEYSLRCAEKIAVINGIAVWHEDFDTKYPGFQEYYIKRNELIMT